MKVDSVMVGSDEREEGRILKGGQVISYFFLATVSLFMPLFEPICHDSNVF